MSEKPKRKQKNTTKQKLIAVIFLIVVLIFVSVVAILVWGASAFSNIEYQASGVEAKLTISYFLGTELPENSTDFYIAHLQWQDIFADMRFSAQSDELEEWLANSSFCPTLQENTISASIPDNYFNVDWWQVTNAQTYTLFESCGDNPTYIVFLDRTNSDIWIIYIRYTSS